MMMEWVSVESVQNVRGSEMAEFFKEEMLYLVCRECGEAFSDFTVAYSHKKSCDDEERFEACFELCTESEAF